jgi:hypothetical protein
MKMCVNFSSCLKDLDSATTIAVAPATQFRSFSTRSSGFTVARLQNLYLPLTRKRIGCPAGTMHLVPLGRSNGVPVTSSGLHYGPSNRDWVLSMPKLGCGSRNSMPSQSVHRRYYEITRWVAEYYASTVREVIKSAFHHRHLASDIKKRFVLRKAEKLNR